MILGIDAGQTGVRAVVAAGGAPAAAPGPQTAGVPRMEGAVGVAEVADALLAAVAEVTLPPGGVAVAGVGLSGFELASEADLRTIAGRLREVSGARRVAVASDGVTSLLGALGRRPGVVVAAGTGVVTLGHDGAGRWAKVDGWGSLLGDDGSGFAIGAAGLRAALRAVDGREGGSAALRAAADRAYGAAETIPVGVHREGSASRGVAAFAPAVAEAARAGDPVAAAIWERAGDDLAVSAAAAAGRLFEAGTAVTVARLGNVWRAGELLDAPFRRGLAQRWPAAAVVGAAGTSLDGAVALARDGQDLAAVPGLLWWER